MRKSICGNYATYEEVMNTKEIFGIITNDGTFFLCFDYYAPEEAKLWYKFSINPFDLDFLKFKKIDYYGLFEKNDPYITLDGLEKMLDYTHSCDSKFTSKNAHFLNEIFFNGGKITTTINELNKYKEMCDKVGDKRIEIYGDNLTSKRAYRLKHKFTIKIKEMLSRIYKQYDFMDDSLEYINKYYYNWVILVDKLQKQKFIETEILYDFIDKYEIVSLLDFYYTWEKVIDGKIKLKKTNYKDISLLYNEILMLMDLFNSYIKKE